MSPPGPASGHAVVADVPGAVADTHALLFHASASRALGRAAAAHFDACERQQALLYVPMAVIWEVSLLARASRINLRRPVQAFFDDLFSNPSYHPLDVTPEQIFRADELRFTRDPFDALICAAAQTIDLPLITRDAQIRGSGTVKVIW
jgi:PIN domain nuclease of toxin-antitoxin system